MPRVVLRFLLALMFAAAAGARLHAQDAVVRRAPRVNMPTAVDSNSPAFWRDGRLFWYGSHGHPWLSEGPDQFGPWQTREVQLNSTTPYPRWMEAVWPEENGVLWGWYHAEPGGLIPNSTLTAPMIGAVVSFDGGYTHQDIGVVLESGEPLNPKAQNGYFAGGHGDFSVLLDRDRRYFYFFFDNYGGAPETQGVCLARMAFEDRFKPEGKVWKYHNGAWREAGRGGRVTPIFPVRKSWEARDPDAFWGPAVHWNTYLNCYVMLLNHAEGEPGWSQEGVYVSFATDLSRPETWTAPRKIVDKSEFSGWYFFYPQVMGLEPGGTDRRAGQVARLYVGGISKWEIEFIAPSTAPSAVQVSTSAPAGGATVGQPVTLSVAPMGLPPFTYQWFKDGVPLAGATDATYALAAARMLDAGTYSVVVTNTLGATASSGVALTVAPAPVTGPAVPATPPPPPPPAPEAFLSNLSVRTVLEQAHSTLSVGFFLHTDATKRLALRAVGPALALFGVADAEPNPSLEVFDASGMKVAESDDWLAADADAFSAVGAFPLPAESRDAAVVASLPSGAGTAVVTAAGGGVALVEIYDPSPAKGSKISNLSARAVVGGGDRAMIAGLSVAGAGTKRVLLRALGPQLAAFGVDRALANPVLEIYDASASELAGNDDWDPALATVFETVGASALPVGSQDAAAVVTLTAGSTYTVMVRGVEESVGEVLLEVYELP